MTLVDNDKRLSPFLFWPIKITKADVLLYSTTPVGRPLSPTSAELMPPGDYAIFYGMI